MNLIEKLLSYIRKPEEEIGNNPPEGLCSLCWGYQQYDGKIRDLFKDKQVDVNNHRDSYLLIQEFVKENLEGIKLKVGEVHSCPTCDCEDENKNKRVKTPIKCHEAMKPLSREHHFGLLLCWKIRQGFKFNVEPRRMKKYSDWFKMTYLDSHFETEEQYVFPVLGNDHELVKRALTEHEHLRRLFGQEENLENTLKQIEEELDSHVRFEERVLFNEIQQVASSDQIMNIENHHNKKSFSDDGWNDKFWNS